MTAGSTFQVPTGSSGPLPFELQILAPNTAFPTTDNAIAYTFNGGTVPTVTIPSAIDASTYSFNGAPDGVTYDIGAGAQTGILQLGDGDNAQVSTVNIGALTTVNGAINGLAGDDVLNIADDVTVTGVINLSAGEVDATIGNGFTSQLFSSVGDGVKDVTFGNDATINGGVVLTTTTIGSGDTASLTFGTGTNVTGDVIVNGPGGDNSITIGDKSSVTGILYSNGANVDSNISLGANNNIFGVIQNGVGANATFSASDSLTTTAAIYVGSTTSPTTVVDIPQNSDIGTLVEAYGENITANVGDGTDVGGYILTGLINQAGVVNQTTLGDNVTTGGNIAVFGVDTDFVAGENLAVGGSMLINNDNSDINVSIGDGATVAGFADFGGLNSNSVVNIGHDFTATGTVFADNTGTGTVDFTAGKNFSAFDLYGSYGDAGDTIRLGNGWTLTGAGFNALTGDDTAYLGTTTDTGGLNLILGGENIGDNDILYLTLSSPAEEASFAAAATAAGWTLNPDGSWNSQDAFGNDLPLNWNGQYISQWEGVYAAVCFARGTKIVTDRGEVLIEELKTGDMVQTQDDGLQPIRWIRSRKISAQMLADHPNLQPIRITAGALGNGLPVSDLVVSPQHRILVRSKIAQRLFDTDEVLVAAKQLLEVKGIDIATDIEEVEYYHFLFDRHQIVISNGAQTESLYTGAQALKSIEPAAREEIFTIFPELRNLETLSPPKGARLLLSGRQGRKLAERHAKNRKPLVA